MRTARSIRSSALRAFFGDERAICDMSVVS